jgi:hypothetical protein
MRAEAKRLMERADLKEKIDKLKAAQKKGK